MNKLFKFLIGVTFLSLTLTACSNASSSGNSSGTTDNPSSVTHEHTYSSSWTYDSTYHWHESTCGHDVISGKSEHTFKDEVTPATYESEGYTTHTCTLCGYSYIDNQTNKLAHNYSTEWSYDEHSHWHACTDSGYENLKKDEEGHRFKEQVVAPTGLEEGYTIHTCSECGYSYRDNYQEKLTYTITWKNYDGSVLETDTNVAYSSTPSYDGPTPTRLDDDKYTYTWSGWDPEVVPAIANQTYTATYSYERIAYTINFDLNGGTSASYSGSKSVEEFSKDIFFFDCVKEGWNFRGWSYNGTKILDEKGNQLANPTMAKNMTFVAMYAQTAKMTIVSNLEGVGIITGEGEYPYNTYVDVSAYAKQGYKFVGWYFQDTLLSNTNEYKYMMWSEDVTLEARFELASFLMNIHSNNENYGLVLLKSTLNNDYLPVYQECRDYTTQVTIAAYSKTDVRFLGWYDNENKLVETNAVYSFIMPNHDYTLEAKWNYFTVNYILNGGTNSSSNPKSYTIDSGRIILNEPTRTGYDFTGWSYNGKIVTEVDPTWIDNITLVANWRAHTYSISYELNGGTNSSSNPSSYTIESSSITLKDATRHGYTFDGWYKTSTFTDKITTINNGGYGNLVLYAKWKPISYSITYNLNGGTNASSNPLIYTIESSFSFADATKTGYQFAGWFDGNGNRVTSISAGTTGALTLTAHWTAKLNNLSVTSEDTSKGTVAITSGSGYSNESITVVATPVVDCIFKGWYHESTKVSDDATYTFIMPTSDYSLVAHFIKKAEEEAIKHATRPIISEDGKTITYGLYPQTNVNDSTLISSLNSLTTQEANGWYLYDGDYYAKVNATPYKSGYTFDNGTTITIGTTYWFKCEPIVWNILCNNNGEYYIVSSVLLDAHCYYNSDSNNRTIGGATIYPNNYKYSDIRTWLNEDFYNSAFALGNEHIQTTTVDNSASTTNNSSNSYACDNTVDKVFLPSYQDYKNSSYGFEAKEFSTSTSRYCKTTDWARARGAYYDTSSSYLYNGFYYTRSPNSYYPGYAGCVFSDGYLDCTRVNGASSSVRPAISIKIL